MARSKSNQTESMTTITLRMPAEGKDAIRRLSIKTRLSQDQIVGNVFFYAKQRGALKLFQQNPPPKPMKKSPQYQVRIMIEVAIAIQLAALDVNMKQGLFIFECWKFAIQNGFLESIAAGEPRQYVR